MDYAKALNEAGRRLSDQGNNEGALAVYKKAIEVSPTWSAPYANLGLAYKRMRRWAECLEWSRRAVELAPEDEAAIWNVGIAATALREWEAARVAWRGVGVKVPDAPGPWDLRLGLTPVRLQPDGEVVWCERLDPVRARIADIPLPASGRRWRDVVLHDGAPRGMRKLNGNPRPVYDALLAMEGGGMGTWRGTILARSPSDLVALGALFDDADAHAEDWSGNVRLLCAQCSLGEPHDHDDDDTQPPWTPRRDVGLAGPDWESLEARLHAWCAAGTGREVVGFAEVLAPER